MRLFCKSKHNVVSAVYSFLIFSVMENTEPLLISQIRIRCKTEWRQNCRIARQHLLLIANIRLEYNDFFRSRTLTIIFHGTSSELLDLLRKRSYSDLDNDDSSDIFRIGTTKYSRQWKGYEKKIHVNLRKEDSKCSQLMSEGRKHLGKSEVSEHILSQSTLLAKMDDYTSIIASQSLLFPCTSYHSNPLVTITRARSLPGRS